VKRSGFVLIFFVALNTSHSFLCLSILFIPLAPTVLSASNDNQSMKDMSVILTNRKWLSVKKSSGEIYKNTLII
jgi:hypothetical protein